MKTTFKMGVGSLLALLSVAMPSNAQDVKYEKYSLPNGMTVILHEDHSLPTATINTWYRVGAQDEPPGRSGFAHLFEHLMFMGTKRVAGNDFDVLMETGGGANNASTDLHRTNYFSWGPSSLLPTLLWLDADRLEDMGLMMNQDKLDKQRDVVRNELRQTVENAPYGKAGEMTFKLLFEPSHPYYYGVIGTHQDLEAANVTNVKDFFSTFYVPSNASLVVAGDFKSAEIKPMIAELFGTIPAGQKVTRKYEMPTEPIAVKLSGERRFTCIDKVQLPKVQFTYHSPRAFASGDAEMNLAGEVLAGGKSSRLYKRLVIDEKLAAEVTAMQQGYPLAGVFAIDVLTLPDADLLRVEKLIDEEVDRLIASGPTQEEMDRNKAQYELGAVTSLQNLRTRADKLNEYEYYLGEPNSFKRDLDRYRNATAADVQQWVKQVCTKGRVVIHVLPEEPERAPSARDTRPGPAAAGEFALPAPAQATLACGAKLLVFTRTDLPIVSVSLVNRHAAWLDAGGKDGLGDLAATMMGEGAGELDALAFGDKLDLLGATFNASCGPESAFASLTTLKRTFGDSLGLFADAIRNPRNEEKDWDRVKSLHLEDLGQEAQNPNAAAARVARQIVFGTGSFMGHSPSGTPTTVEALTLEQIKAAQQAMFDPSRATFLVAGDITPAEAKAALDKAFANWKPSASTFTAVSGAPAAPSTKMRLAIVDRPGAVQTVVRFYAPGVAFSDATRVQRSLLNTILGGSFTSRLNQNLREDHGYTYGARSSFEMNIAAGAFSAGAAVKAEVTGEAVAEFMKEFARIAAGDISENEANKARETQRNDTISSFEGLRGMTGAAATFLLNGMPIDTTVADLAAMQKVTAADLNALAKKAFALDAGVLVLVGDKKLILEEIKNLGLGTPVEYSALGEAK
jgi:predicted Zn-dependent peptidase